MIFIANFTDIFIFKDKLTSVQLPSFFFLHRFRKGIKKSHQNSGIIMFVYFCFRRKCNMQRQRSRTLEMSANCNIYGVANTKFKRMFTLVYESYRSK